MADVEVTYNNNTIVELSESGTKTLKTAGKYCEGDIVLKYTRPDTLCFLFGFQNTIASTGGYGYCTLDGTDTYVDWSGNISGYYSGVRSWTGLSLVQYSDRAKDLTAITTAKPGNAWTLDFFADWRRTNDNCKFTINFAGFSFARQMTGLKSFTVNGTSVSLASHTYSHASHMAFVYTGEVLRIFENGELIDAKTVALTSNPVELTMSSRFVSSSKVGSVVLSNLRLVSKVLGAENSFPVPTQLYTGNEEL